MKQIARAWSWNRKRLPPKATRRLRGQARFAAFVWTGILFVGGVLMVAVAIVAAVTGQTPGVWAGLLAGTVFFAGFGGLWRIRRWWWPPIRDDDLPSRDRKRQA